MKIFSKIKTIVNKNVEYYKSDFFDYDLPNLQKVDQGRYIWIVRKCGTNLVNIDGDLCVLDYYMNETGDGVKAYYIIDIAADTIKEIDVKEIPAIKSYTLSFKNYNNIFQSRKISLQAFDNSKADLLAKNLFDKIGVADGFTHYELMPA